MRKNILTLLAVASAGLTMAQDSLSSKMLNEIVVTGTRYETQIQNSTKTITKLSGDDLKAFADGSVSDVLNSIAGLQIDGNYGAPGSNIGYYARGARNRQTVILIDGVPMVDASGINPEYDLRLLSLDQVDNIEVMRGGLSTLYGSGAAAAVINIQLKKPQAGTHGNLNINGGSFKTHSENLSIGVSEEKYSLQLIGNNLDSRGFSSAKDVTNSNHFDDDGIDRRDVLIRLGYKPQKNVDIQLFGGIDKFNADYDDGAYADAPNKQISKQQKIGATGTYKYNKGVLKATFQNTKIEKEFKSSYPEIYDSHVTNTEVYGTFYLSQITTLVGGISLQHLSYDQKDLADKDTINFTIFDPYLSVVFEFAAGFVLQSGVRLNHHSDYGEHIVYDISPSYKLKLNDNETLKVYGSLSTSYVTPSLYQLFSYYGNSSLKPEESLNAEGGVVLYARHLTTGLVYYYRNDEAQIGFQSFYDDMDNFVGGEYYNMTGKGEVHGLELETTYKVSDAFSLKGMYTYATTKNLSTFYRIPKSKANLIATFNTPGGTGVVVKYQYTGNRRDFDYSKFEEVSMDQFQLFDVMISQMFLSHRLRVYGSCNNIFDTDYEWAPGFNSQPRNFKIGLQYGF